MSLPPSSQPLIDGKSVTAKEMRSIQKDAAIPRALEKLRAQIKFSLENAAKPENEHVEYTSNAVQAKNIRNDSRSDDLIEEYKARGFKVSRLDNVGGENDNSEEKNHLYLELRWKDEPED